MKHGITIQERLKDLRTERHLKLEELAELTKISKSALVNYENDDKKEISHKSILQLVEFYGPCSGIFEVLMQFSNSRLN